MLSIPSLTSSTSAANSSSSGGKGVINERTVPPTTLLNQQVYASLADLLGKLRDGVIISFLQRSALYDADIRRLDSLRGSTQFDFWQLFLVKESYALMYQMMQMPDRSFILYEELETLLMIAPMASLPDNDWPMIVDPTITASSKTKPSQPTDNTSSSSSLSSSMLQNNTSTSNSTTSTDQHQVQNMLDRNIPNDDQSSIQTSFNSTINSNNNNIPISNKAILKSRNNLMNEKEIPSKGDLFTDACRNGEDIIAYSINQARMNILYNKYSYLQLQHYIFARQMYFLLIHLRQPIKCAEKALSYIIISNANIEKRIQARHSKLMSSNSNELTSDKVTVDSTDSLTHSEVQQMQLMELRIAQCNVWTIVSALRLIRECRALLQLLVGDDCNGGDNNNDRLSGYYSMRASSSQHNSMMMMMIGSDSLEDNLAAISSASTHGNSVVYQSLAELSRSQHGLSHGRKHGSSLETTPANIIREALFSPQTEINIVLRDSSKVLSDLMDYALKKLHLISQSFQAKKISKLSMELALSTSLYSASSSSASSSSSSASSASSSSSSSSVIEQLHLDGTSIRSRTITKFIPSTSTTIHTDSIISSSSMDTTHGVVIQPMIRRKKINPSNEDIITCIEQELQLLDDTNVDIGNRMDQVTKSTINLIMVYILDSINLRHQILCVILFFITSQVMHIIIMIMIIT
jgi:hypothetical protein